LLRSTIISPPVVDNRSRILLMFLTSSVSLIVQRFPAESDSIKLSVFSSSFEPVIVLLRPFDNPIAAAG
jgi:hypothetical protein